MADTRVPDAKHGKKGGVENERIYIDISSKSQYPCGFQPSLLWRECYEKVELVQLGTS
jgi:hypothetical protein